MKKFLKEFKEFALKGNVMSLAVGMIIGTSFSGLVTALLDNIISPIIGCFNTGGFNNLSITIGKATLQYGAFLNAVINFLIMAFIVFLMVKAVNKLTSIGKKEEEVSPTTKICPYCKSEIDIEATKCPHCTSDVPAESDK
ncbi:MAG: large conductance mechanosensitive channel protein MscL [Wujia sp.]